jgi:cell division septal protein FtsQ
MLKYHEKAKEEAVNNWISKRKTFVGNCLSRNKRSIAGVCILALLCIAIFDLILPNVKLENFIAFQKITPKNLNRLSEDAFRKIIGYDYEEKIYLKDTAEIRARLDASNMVFGDIQFSIKLLPYELEIKFSEVKPLFVIMPQSQNSTPLIYSDKGKIYPYSVNIADLPVVDTKNQDDIALATSFLIDMRKNDPLLYMRISQLIPKETEKQITVFFNDVEFKTKFSLESDYWKTAFRHYRQMTRNMKILNVNSIAILDLRFKQMAYTI